MKNAVLVCGGLLTVLFTLQAIQAELQSPFEDDPEIPGSEFPRPGGWHKIDVNSDEVREIAAFASHAVGERRNSASAAVVGAIHSARAQVVQGARYNVVFSRHQSTAGHGASHCSISTERCRALVTRPIKLPLRLDDFNCLPLLGH